MPDTWDYTDVTLRTKIYSSWFGKNETCPSALNKAVQDTFPEAVRLGSHDFLDNRKLYEMFPSSIVDDIAFNHIVADLLDFVQ